MRSSGCGIFCIFISTCSLHFCNAGGVVANSNLYSNEAVVKELIEKLQSVVDRQTVEIENLKMAVEKQNEEMETLLKGNKLKGSSYTRWGRTTCEGDALEVYRGYTAGPHYGNNGGGSNFLCLHDTPQWNRYVSGFATPGGIIYGAEYKQTSGGSLVFTGGQSIDRFPAPCVVCHVPSRTSVIMVPGRMECPSGYRREYHGYVTSDAIQSNHHRSQFICFDEAPEKGTGEPMKNQALIYPTQVQCGSLPCSQYVSGRELTCVVCSK